MKTKKPNRWIILAYDVPNEPSRLRVRVWRELKKFGALYPDLSFCILPNTVSAKKESSIVKGIIGEHGKVVILEGKALSKQDHGLMLQLFEQETKRRYEEILEECQEFLHEIKENIVNLKLTGEEAEEMEESLTGLERWFVRVKAADWSSNSSRKVEQALKKCRETLVDFVEKVQARDEAERAKKRSLRM
jgi:hypothetical protein